MYDNVCNIKFKNLTKKQPFYNGFRHFNNLKLINSRVIRPVACFDKLEIIDIAKKIDTYDTSILPYEDCCTIFVPDHPIINPDKNKCEEYEKLINYEDMIYKAIKNHQVIKISSKKENEFQNYL